MCLNLIGKPYICTLNLPFIIFSKKKKKIPFKKIFKPPFTGCSSLIWNIIVFANLDLGFRCNNVYLLKMSCLIFHILTSI